MVHIFLFSRAKGKTYRLRTPICRALKRLTRGGAGGGHAAGAAGGGAAASRASGGAGSNEPSLEEQVRLLLWE